MANIFLADWVYPFTNQNKSLVTPPLSHPFYMARKLESIK